MRLRQRVRVHAENFTTRTAVNGDRLTRADVTLYLGGVAMWEADSYLLRVDRVVR